MRSSLTRRQLRSWVRLVGGITGLLNAVDRQLRTDSGISHDDYLILSWLSRTPGKTKSMSELAAAVGHSPSRLSHAVTRLEEHGWVFRSRGEPDRRVTLARLTDEGESFVREASGDHLALIREMVFETLGDDEARRVAEGMDRVGRSDPHRGAHSPSK